MKQQFRLYRRNGGIYYIHDDKTGKQESVCAYMSFTANCNWTLQILDSSSTVVRTATGSGTSMEFDWDGKNGSGSDLPVGNYTYSFSAQTNGSAFSMMSERSSSVSSLAVDDTPVLSTLPWASASRRRAARPSSGPPTNTNRLQR